MQTFLAPLAISAGPIIISGIDSLPVYTEIMTVKAKDWYTEGMQKTLQQAFVKAIQTTSKKVGVLPYLRQAHWPRANPTQKRKSSYPQATCLIIRWWTTIHKTMLRAIIQQDGNTLSLAPVMKKTYKMREFEHKSMLCKQRSPTYNIIFKILFQILNNNTKRELT